MLRRFQVLTNYDRLILTLFLVAATFVVYCLTFANSLEPDQDRPIGPDLDPNCMTL